MVVNLCSKLTLRKVPTNKILQLKESFLHSFNCKKVILFGCPLLTERLKDNLGSLTPFIETEVLKPLDNL